MTTTTFPKTAAAADLRYSTVAIILHWAIAAAILYNLASGLLRSLLPTGFFQFHVSSGITILVLSVARVAWRLTHRPPAFLPMRRWERATAHVVHALLYAAILLVPVSGWALVSAKPPVGSAGAAWSAAHSPVAPKPAAPGNGQKPDRPRGPTMVWGLFRLPLLSPITEIGREPTGVARQRDLRGKIETFHLLAAWAMFGLLLLHISGALKHQLIDRHRALARMRFSVKQ
ncbi:hypothetical protein BH10PSE15_BH10PSE15_02680 [soil metagenome]